MRSHRKSVDRLRREMAADQWKRFMRGAGAQSPHLFSSENPSRDRTAFHSASEGDVKTLMKIDWTKPIKKKITSEIYRQTTIWKTWSRWPHGKSLKLFEFSKGGCWNVFSCLRRSDFWYFHKTELGDLHRAAVSPWKLRKMKFQIFA